MPQNFSAAFLESSWLNGPAFLNEERKSWPERPNDIDLHDCLQEKISKFVLTINQDSVIPFEKYSNFNELVRTMCWVRRAVTIFKSHDIFQKESKPAFGIQLSAGEIDETVEYLCNIVQQNVFFEKYHRLMANKPVSKSSPIFKLTPFLSENGLLRLSGRINNATYIARSAKEPIILPKKHILTKLIVKQYHDNCNK